MTKALGLSPHGRLAGLAPLLVRVVVGIIMSAHGLQKLTQMGPGTFGSQMLAGLGVPLPGLMGYVVTFVELFGGILLVLGLLSRLSALLLAINLAIATLLVKTSVGLIAPEGAGAGAELDLALISGLLVILLLGPGKLSLDYALGIESDADAVQSA